MHDKLLCEFFPIAVWQLSLSALLIQWVNNQSLCLSEKNSYRLFLAALQFSSTEPSFIYTCMYYTWTLNAFLEHMWNLVCTGHVPLMPQPTLVVSKAFTWCGLVVSIPYHASFANSMQLGIGAYVLFTKCVDLLMGTELRIFASKCTSAILCAHSFETH